MNLTLWITFLDLAIFYFATEGVKIWRGERLERPYVVFSWLAAGSVFWDLAMLKGWL